MNKMSKTSISEESPGSSSMMKKLWPCFAAYSSYAFTISALFINIIITSNIMWPGEPFHSMEIGILIGITTYVMAISGILFGYLTDRVSRIKLFSLGVVSYGFGLFLNGFAPEGLGSITFTFFIICSMIRGFFSGGFWPIINSYANDATQESQRSQFFGALNSIFQVVQIIGMVISAIFFQTSLWRIFFWLNGLVVIVLGIIILKGKEQKRAANHSELKEILSDDNITYDYKLNKETIRSTVLSKTNVIAFAEGIFTTVLLAVPDFLLIAYLQSPPYNLSPLTTSLFMIIFGIPGGILGAIIFAKISDRLAKKSIKNRIYLIIFSIVSIYIVFVIVFSVPLPHLTADEGNNLLYIFSFPFIWILGVCALMARSVMGLYNINQPPVLQKINLPEAQGIVSSSNQFLELIGSGTGPILAGILLITFNHNYQVTVFLTMGIGIFGALMWILATIWIEKDVNRVSSILRQRGEELNGKHNNKNIALVLEK